MKPTIQQISLKESKGSKKVLASVFDEATWASKIAYSAFQHGDYVYAMMRTNETDTSFCYKRFPVGYSTKSKCLLVSKCHPWI